MRRAASLVLAATETGRDPVCCSRLATLQHQENRHHLHHNHYHHHHHHHHHRFFLVFCLRVEEVQVIEASRSCVSALEDTAKEQSRHRYTMAPVLRQRGSTQAGPIGTLKVSCTKAVLRQRGATKAAPIGTLKIDCSKAVQLETNTWMKCLFLGTVTLTLVPNP